MPSGRTPSPTAHATSGHAGWAERFGLRSRHSGRGREPTAIDAARQSPEPQRESDERPGTMGGAVGLRSRHSGRGREPTAIDATRQNPEPQRESDERPGTMGGAVRPVESSLRARAGVGLPSEKATVIFS